MGRRFPGSASIEYVNTDDPDSLSAYPTEVQAIRDRGLIYPVTFVDGEAVYDGAVSYPGIIRAVESRLGAPA